MKNVNLLCVFSLFAIGVKVTIATNPWNHPNLVPMFNGANLKNWAASKADEWVVKNGTIHSTGTGEGWLYYNKLVGDFRWIFNVRQIKGDHDPSVLFWGTLSPVNEGLNAIQFEPPNIWRWDYRTEHTYFWGDLFKVVRKTKLDIHKWNQCEILANHKTGLARMACCQLNEGPTCKAVENIQFKDKTAGRLGLIALQVHNAGIEDEYRNLYLESPVADLDNFITV